MKNFIFLFCTILINAYILCAQSKTTFDLVTCTAPEGEWKKEVAENTVSYSIINKENGSWCRISIIKSTGSKGSIDLDFESEWRELVAKYYKTTEAPQVNPVEEANGWKIKIGAGKFDFNNSDAIAMLATASGFNRCVSILAITNSEEYLDDIDSFLLSVDLKKPENGQYQLTQQSKDQQGKPASPAISKGFTFSTTNFDDGWTSVAQEDWVQVTRGTTIVLIHYPNKQADDYNTDLMERVKNAWNILVAPKYSEVTGLEFKPVSYWQSLEFAEADVVEKKTGRTVHVVLFKKNVSGGNGRYLEFITPDKKSFEREFGAFSATPEAGEKMEAMANYNKFAIAASDLAGNWTSNFSGVTQYVNVHTGLDAGMNTNASVENFQIGPGNTYKWDLTVANGFVGNIKFQNVKSTGRFSMKGNWQINFSDIEGKSRTYNAWFSCIKGFRILWIDDKAFAKKD